MAWRNGGTLKISKIYPDPATGKYDYLGTKGQKIEWEMVPMGELFVEEGTLPGDDPLHLSGADGTIWPDIVEKGGGGRGIISHRDSWGQSMMVGRQVEQGSLFYDFSLERHVPAGHLLRSIDRFVELGELGANWPVLQRHWPALDRSGADDPDADRRLLLRHPLGAAAVRRGPPQPCIPLVLPARAGRRRARPLDLLEDPPWPVPRERPAAAVCSRPW